MSIVTYNNRSIRNISAIPGAAKALTHIKTLTASSSGDLTFVNGSSDVVLDSTYPIYLFKFINIHPANDDADTLMLGSSDSGSNYNVAATSSFFQAFHPEDDSSPSIGYLTTKDVAQGTSGVPIEHSVGNDNDQSSSGFMYLFNPSSTTFVKHFIARFNISHAGDNSQDIFAAGYFNTTSAIDAIQFKKDTGNIDAGTIKLYGIKDS